MKNCRRMRAKAKGKKDPTKTFKRILNGMVKDDERQNEGMFQLNLVL